MATKKSVYVKTEDKSENLVDERVKDFFPEDTDEVEVEVSNNFFFVSPKHSQLFTALAKAQSEIEAAVESHSNTFYNSKYANIHDVSQAVKEPLAKNGLFYMQMWEKGSSPNELLLRTMIGHSSGEEIWFVSSVLCPDPTNSQKVGASLTYSKRYALAGALGVTSTEAQFDDDANILQFSDKDVYNELKEVAANGVVAFREVWKKSAKLYRAKITQTDLAKLEKTARAVDKENGTEAPPPSTATKPSVVRSEKQEAHSV